MLNFYFSQFLTSLDKVQSSRYRRYKIIWHFIVPIFNFVEIAVRSKEKGDDTCKEIKKAVSNANVESMVLDLSSMKSVRSFVDEFKSKKLPLHVLLNNAGSHVVIMLKLFIVYSKGVLGTPHSKTEDGIEMQLGVNHIGNTKLSINLTKSNRSFFVDIAVVGYFKK